MSVDSATNAAYSPFRLDPGRVSADEDGAGVLSGAGELIANQPAMVLPFNAAQGLSPARREQLDDKARSLIDTHSDRSVMVSDGLLLAKTRPLPLISYRDMGQIATSIANDGSLTEQWRFCSVCPGVEPPVRQAVARWSSRLHRRRPNTQRAVLGRMRKVSIGGQQGELASDAHLRDQCIDRADLHTRSPALVAQLRGGDVIVTVRMHERQRTEPLHDRRPGLGAGKALQQFLKDQAGGHHQLNAGQGVRQHGDFGHHGGRVAAKSERPDARIDEQTHFRDRCAL
jgi:hypothetical protein